MLYRFKCNRCDNLELHSDAKVLQETKHSFISVNQKVTLNSSSVVRSAVIDPQIRYFCGRCFNIIGDFSSLDALYTELKETEQLEVAQ